MPGHPLEPPVGAPELTTFSVQDHDFAVPMGGSVCDGDVTPVDRNPGRRPGLVEPARARRELQRVVGVVVSRHDDRAPRQPVGPVDVFGDVPGRAAGERSAGQGPDAAQVREEVRLPQEEQLPAPGNRGEVGVRDAEGPRFGAVDARREDLHGPAFPRGAVEDGLSVGRETRVQDVAALEGQATKERDA